MADTASFYSLAESLRRQRRSFLAVTVIEINGSAATHVGAKALFTSEGHLCYGWLGGPCIHAHVSEQVTHVLQSRQPAIITVDLRDESGQTGMPCGGQLRLFLDPHNPALRLWLVGANEISRQICLLANQLAYDTVLYSPTTVNITCPANTAVIGDDIGLEQLTPGPDDYVVVLTQHKNDVPILQRLFQSPTRFIGVYASRSRARLLAELCRRQGISDEDLARLHAPVGRDFGSRTPAETALEIVAEILRHERCASGAPRHDPVDHSQCHDGRATAPS